jgi:hypothetical protein
LIAELPLPGAASELAFARDRDPQFGPCSVEQTS